MKKIFPILTLLSILGVILVPALAFAQDVRCQIRHSFSVGPQACSPSMSPCTISTIGGAASTDSPPGCSQCCVLDSIFTITDWFFLIVLAIAVIFILIAAFNFITAGGSEEKVGIARQFMIYAAVGIIVALLAKALPAIVKAIVGIS